MNKRILIVGYGNIGKHIYKEFELIKEQISIYDPYLKIDEYTGKQIPNITFICVPTDKRNDGSADISIVEKCVKEIYSDIIVIKSTVPVGTCEKLKSKYKKNIVYSPEYYGTTQHAPQSPNFVVLAGDKSHCDEISQLYYKVKTKDFRIRFTDYKTAELAKYMENCFLALKVTFCAEFATIAKEMGVSYPQLREIFVLDERMGDTHTFIDPEKPYYDSHCLNKDIPALISQTNKAHIMNTVHYINRQKRIDKMY